MGTESLSLVFNLAWMSRPLEDLLHRALYAHRAVLLQLRPHLNLG